MQVQDGNFTPHVSNRQHGKRMSKKFYTRLSQMIRERHDINYGIVAASIRRKISFFIKGQLVCVFAEADQLSQQLH